MHFEMWAEGIDIKGEMNKKETEKREPEKGVVFLLITQDEQSKKQ